MDNGSTDAWGRKEHRYPMYGNLLLTISKHVM